MDQPTGTEHHEYACLNCDRTFRTAAEMNAHINQAHPDNYGYPEEEVES